MEAENKSNSNLFAALYPHIREPFLVFDSAGNILSYNKKISEFLNPNEEESNLYSILDEKSSQEFKNILENKLPIEVPLSIEAGIILPDNKKLKVKLVLNSYVEKNETFIFCRIGQDDKKIPDTGKTTFLASSEELKDVINNATVLSLIEEISSLYPFTYIGKEKLQKIINEIPEIFWVEDAEGNYQLVNNKLAKSVGIEITQLDGESVSSFLPSHLIDFYTSVISYIKKSLKFVVSEGVPVKGFKSGDNQQTVQIPLRDVDNRVIAIIGVTQEAKSKRNEMGVTEFLNTSENLLQYLPKAVCLIDNDGIIKQTTEDFRKLFEVEIHDLRKLNYRNILPEEIVRLTDEFRESNRDEELFTVKIQSKLKEKYFGENSVQIKKILNSEFEPEGISLYLEKVEDISEIEKLISKRGKMFDILIGNNPEPIFIYDTENLRFLEANKATLDLYGYKKEEFLQMDLTDLYTPEDIQTLLDTSHQGVNAGEFSGPYRHKKKDGTSVFVELSRISFIFQEKEAHYNVVRNVTEKLEIEKKFLSYKSILDNTHDPVFITDSTGFITFANGASADYLGYSADEFIKSSFISYIDNDDRAIVNNSIFKADKIEEKTIKLKIKKGDGSIINTNVSASPVFNFDGNVESFTLVLQAKSDSEAPVEIKEVVKEVIVEKPVYTTIKGKENTESRNEPAFLSSLFHEILTPINVILGFVQDLTDGIKNPTSEQKESVEIISQNRERLLNSMNSIIEYTNIEKNNVEFDISEVAITEIIDYLQNNIDEITGSKDVEFGYGKISSSLIFKTDKTKFQHLIVLLTKIAANASKDKMIYLSAYPDEKGNFIISIRDNYSYMSDYMLRIYKAVFSEIENETTKDFGTSKLTLRLANSLLKLLSGEYKSVEQEKDKSDFNFIFPIEFSKTDVVVESDESEPQQEENITEETKEENPISKEIEEEFTNTHDIDEEVTIPEEQPVEIMDSGTGKFELSNYRCLYIEDQVDSQILFKVQMKELKEIKFAVGFEEALPLLDNEIFDFIVMDINLQGEYNGLDALKIIQKMPGYENIPIIAATAYVLPGDKEKFIAAGFNDFISKPIFREKMVEALKKIFSMQV